ncbi:MAG: trehalose-phosphatase [Aeromicrobium sp.]
MTSPDFAAALARIVADPAGTLLALDFDGTLAHIVDDPATAYGQAHAVEALSRLGPLVGRVAIVTGRPVHQVLELGGFLGRPGLEHLVVCGQYGAERWDAVDGAPVPSGLTGPVRQALDVLPGWLADHGVPDARLESKGLAVAVHTRGLAEGAQAQLLGPLTDLAGRLGLQVELGREVIELRAAGWDKGRVIEGLVDEFGVRHVVFAGDDLGDLPAYDAVDRLRDRGFTGVLVCSASEEQPLLAERADVVVDGPDGVATWLTELADALA